MYKCTYICKTETDTENLAQALAEVTSVGDVWALFGTLGMGKSVWARAFVRHLTDADDVPSPTFTLVQTYPADNFDIYHYDLYRLKSAEEIWELNIEEAMYGAVCLIEWPEKAGAYLPRDAFRVEITALPDNGRKVTITVNNSIKKDKLLACRRKPDEQCEG